ncbi:sigma-54-dependent transcriptional regulator [Gemmatimonas sp.]|uniref:sigma-54-dependent transcriptional regulator n=1 Tax=Gemmatimonas sp. TaxID=1962908 RepID=UPI003567F269
MATVLCIDDDPLALSAVANHLLALGHTALRAEGPANALGVLANRDVDVVVTDFQLPGMTGADLLTLVRDQGHQCPFIVVTAFASIEHSVSSMRAGAVTYLAKPVARAQLEAALGQALELVTMRKQVDTLRAEVTSAHASRRILGNSPQLREIMRTIAAVASTRATVLIEGESGTGKELFARALHDMSDRARRPFIRLNCAALPEGLIESALFGHERGAFTGAVRRSEGAFERADGGTLLLDEVSEMRLDLQAKLLRVLQEREFERVGGSSVLNVDVRVLATTNRNLAADAGAGTFRSDLYYRLNVVNLRVPPLRQRPDDIVVLANSFVQRFAEESGRKVDRIDAACLERLCELPWPGNVRELEHAVYRAVLLSEGPVLTWNVFEGSGRGLRVAETEPEGQSVVSAPSSLVTPLAPVPCTRCETPEVSAVLRGFDLGDAEQVLIDGALQKAHSNRTRAASMLGINVRTLRRKLAERGRARLAVDEPSGEEDTAHDVVDDIFPSSAMTSAVAPVPMPDVRDHATCDDLPVAWPVSNQP